MHQEKFCFGKFRPFTTTKGLTHFAHVVSPDSFAALSAETMSMKIGNSFLMQIFGDFIEARNWLAAAHTPAG
jgi:hypothetical protein